MKDCYYIYLHQLIFACFQTNDVDIYNTINQKKSSNESNIEFYCEIYFWCKKEKLLHSRIQFCNGNA